MRSLVLTTLLFVVFAGVVVVVASPSHDTNITCVLNVGVYNESAPFVFVDRDGLLVGYDVDLAFALLKRLPVPCVPNFVTFSTLTDLLDALAANDSTPPAVDLGLSGLSITKKRVAAFDLSEPYFASWLQVAVPRTPTSDALLQTFSAPLVQATFASFIIILVLTAHAIWLAERAVNPLEFDPSSYAAGVSDALWFTTSVLSTNGFGDKVPRSRTGKCLVVMLMVFSVTVTAILTAAISAALTSPPMSKSDIHSFSSLANRRVGIVAGRLSGSYAQKHVPAMFIEYPSISQALAGALEGTVDGVIDDTAALLFTVNQAGFSNLQVVGKPKHKQDYGVAVCRAAANASALLDQINDVLHRLEDEAFFDNQFERWFPNAESTSIPSLLSGTHIPHPMLSAMWWTALALLGLTLLASAASIACRARRASTAASADANAPAAERTKLLNADPIDDGASTVAVGKTTPHYTRRIVRNSTALYNSMTRPGSMHQLIDSASLGAADPLEALSLRVELAELRASSDKMMALLQRLAAGERV